MVPYPPVASLGLPAGFLSRTLPGEGPAGEGLRFPEVGRHPLTNFLWTARWKRAGSVAAAWPEA